MLPENMKVGLEISIGPNIDKTHDRLQSCDEMHRMCGDGRLYTITSVHEHSSSYDTIKVAHVGEYSWHPDDLIWDGEIEIKDVSTALGEKEVLNLNELCL